MISMHLPGKLAYLWDEKANFICMVSEILLLVASFLTGPMLRGVSVPQYQCDR